MQALHERGYGPLLPSLRSIGYPAALPVARVLLFVDLSVYRWRARDEQAIAAYYVGAHAESVALCEALLVDPNLPESERARVAANARFGRDALAGGRAAGQG